jgi:hypothetical protein
MYVCTLKPCCIPLHSYQADATHYRQSPLQLLMLHGNARQTPLSQLHADLKSCLKRGQLSVEGSGSMGTGTSSPPPSAEEKSSNEQGTGDVDGAEQVASGNVLMGMRFVPSKCSVPCARSKAMPPSQNYVEGASGNPSATSRNVTTCEVNGLSIALGRCQQSCSESSTLFPSRVSASTTASSLSGQCLCKCQQKAYGLLGCEWASWMRCAF